VVRSEASVAIHDPGVSFVCMCRTNPTDDWWPRSPADIKPPAPQAEAKPIFPLREASTWALESLMGRDHRPTEGRLLSLKNDKLPSRD
jgi:hypothetical protein